MASLDTANNERSKINSELLKFTDELIKELKLKNFDFRVFEGYRSNERQNYLYSVKKTTSLKAGESKHNKLPSEALSIVEYKKNVPTWGGYILGSDFKKIVNNLLLNYPKISWGGNWSKPLPYQFEITTVSTPKTINPPQIPATPIPKPIAIQVPTKTIIEATKLVDNPNLIKPAITPASVKVDNPNLIKPDPIINKPILTPASVKMEVDNSTVIIAGVGLLIYLFIKRK